MANTRISVKLPPNIDPTKSPVAFGTRAIPRLASELEDPELLTRQRALSALCDLAHDPERAYEAIETGCLEKLKVLLKDEDSTVRVKTTEIVHLLANHNLGRQALLKHNLVLPLSELLDEPVDACRKNAHQALGQLAEFPAGAHCLLSLGLVGRLVMKVPEEQEEIQALILATLANCVRPDAQPALHSGGVANLHGLLSHTSSDIRRAAARALVGISVPTEGKEVLCDKGVVPALVNLLEDSDPGVKANAAGVIMNTAVITKGKYEALNCGAIPPLLALVDSEEQAACANALRALTVLAEVPSARQQLLEHIPRLETQLTHPVPIIRQAAATVIRVITWQP